MPWLPTDLVAEFRVCGRQPGSWSGSVRVGPVKSSMSGWRVFRPELVNFPEPDLTGQFVPYPMRWCGASRRTAQSHSAQSKCGCQMICAATDHETSGARADEALLGKSQARKLERKEQWTSIYRTG